MDSFGDGLSQMTCRLMMDIRGDVADTQPVIELRGWDLAISLRALLHDRWQEEFDGTLDLFARGPHDVSECGAFSSLSAGFRRAVEAGDEPSIRAVMLAAEGLMAECEGRLNEPDLDDFHTALVTCFLENVLPVQPDRFALVAPLIGPATRRWAERYQQWWLEPEPSA